MTEAILGKYKQTIESLSLVPHEGGRFELSVNGELVYSKLETGEFPEHTAILQEIDRRV